MKKIFTKTSKSLLLTLMLTFGAFLVQAQEEEESAPALSISGSIDTYYRANLNATNDGDNGGTLAPGTSFANLPGFSLGMANIVLGMEGEKSGFVADLVFGPRGAEAVFGSKASLNIVNQLYAYWNVSDNNYSTSYMFSYGPFSHTGLKADITAGDVSMMFGVFNPTDMTDFNETGMYLGGAQFGYAGQYLNFLFGDGYFQVDYTGGFDLSDATYLGINATFNKDLFSGAALYLQQSFTDNFSLGLRGEYFSDVDDVVLGFDPNADESVIDITLSANYTVGKLTFIPEFRIDTFSEDSVVPDFNETDTQGALASFLVAAVYAF
jgi:hypothetical protein